MENMHVYCKHIKARNTKGLVVQGVSFYDLYDAEEYCLRKDLPMSKDILTVNPDKAKKFAHFFECELKYVEELLKAARKKEQKKLDAQCEQYDCMKKLANSIIDEGSLEVHEKRICETIGVLGGLDAAISIVRKRADEQWRLSRLNMEGYNNGTDEK